MHFEQIIIRREGAVAILQLSWPKVLNALMMAEVFEALESLDRDGAVHFLILTGDEKSFAAGADILEFVRTSPIEIMQKYGCCMVKGKKKQFLRLKNVA